MDIVRNFRYQKNSGKTSLFVSPYPQFIQGRDGEIDLLQEYADVIYKKKSNLTEEEQKKLKEYNDIVKQFIQQNANAKIIIDSEIEKTKINVFGRTKSVENIENNYIKNKRELVWVDGAENVSGTIELPHAKTYDKIYIITGNKNEPKIQFINSFEKEQKFQRTKNPERPYYIKNFNTDTTTIYVNHFSGGAGTQVDPYIIENATELQNIKNDLSAHYKLGNDIDGEGAIFERIGDWHPLFNGSFDGDGYVIKNFELMSYSHGPTGIFGVCDGATIKNVGFENITGITTNGQPVGPISIIQNNSIVENCYSIGGTFSGEQAGTLVGLCDNSTIRNCYSHSNIDGGTQAAGFVYETRDGSTIEYCYTNGTISNITNYDPFCLTHNDVDMSTCYFNSLLGTTITSANSISDMSNQSNYIDWDFTNTWVMNDDTPQLQLFSQPVPTLNGSGTSTDPYLINSLDDLKILSEDNSYWTGYINLTTNIDATDSNTWNDGDGINIIGSVSNDFAGVFNGNGYIISNLTGKGFFGNVSGIIKNLGLENVILDKETDFNYAGGICRELENGGLITNSYVTGLVSALHVGGFVGRNYGTISNCYADVDCQSNSGYNSGFICENYSTDIIENCYSRGPVTGGNSNNGFCDYNPGDTITNCYWDINNSESTTSNGGYGLTSIEMQNKSNFTDWDFNNIWVMDTSFPVLQEFYDGPTISQINNVSNITVDHGTSLNDAISNLPSTTTIIDSEGFEHTVNLVWDIIDYDGNIVGDYDATATFLLPDSVAQSDPPTNLELNSIVSVAELVKIKIIELTDYQNIIDINPSSILNISI